MLTNRITESYNNHKNPSNYYIMNLQPNTPNSKIQTLYELTIPTCSYRMGVPEMGYGVLTISKKGLLKLKLLGKC